ncbi:MAG TPA: hypothetical protein VNH18_31445 [Bryobacteraceae bacterium]|nr:hypothetical protein [Bryobacteraceae bacterium]
MRNSGRPSPESKTQADAELRLDALLRSYRAACPDPEASINFMPQLWEKIERRRSANVFSRAARVLVTAALAATAILGIILSAHHPSGMMSAGAYVEALVTDGDAALDLLNPENLAETEQL